MESWLSGCLPRCFLLQGCEEEIRTDTSRKRPDRVGKTRQNPFLQSSFLHPNSSRFPTRSAVDSSKVAKRFISGGIDKKIVVDMAFVFLQRPLIITKSYAQPRLFSTSTTTGEIANSAGDRQFVQLCVFS